MNGHPVRRIRWWHDVLDWRDRHVAGVGALALMVVLSVGWVTVGDPLPDEFAVSGDVPVPQPVPGTAQFAAETTVDQSTPSVVSSPLPASGALAGDGPVVSAAPAAGTVAGSAAATVSAPVTRLPAVHVADLELTPHPIPGDCGSWAAVFTSRGATADEVEFFFGGIVQRETDCGSDLVNERTGDTGVCQINPVHARPGWFGRVEFGAGGWLHALHGLGPHTDPDDVRWVDACLTLYRVCGSGPWRPPYSCSNNPLSEVLP